jgi:hypothetical protein
MSAPKRSCSHGAVIAGVATAAVATVAVIAYKKSGTFPR